MRALLLALGLIATPAATADQFDLICTTEIRYLPYADFRPSDDDLHYRVDLAAQRWCEGECNKTEPISASNDNALFLRWHMRESALDRYERERINRRSGELSIVMIGAGPLGSFVERRGECEQVEFTGFPDPG